MKRTRVVAALLAFLHAGLATQAFLHLADAVGSASAALTVGDFPCASHNCGCKTAEYCRTQCCCSPVEEAEEPSCCHAAAKPAPKPLSLLEAERCRGGAGESLQHAVFAMALPPGDLAPRSDLASNWAATFEISPDPDVVAQRCDKVPILSAPPNA